MKIAYRGLMRLFFMVFGVYFFVIASGHAQLLPHKAEYTIALHSHKQGSDIQDITGTLEFSLQKNCRAWVTNYNSDIVHHARGGIIKPIKSKFSSVEYLDGSSLEYAVRRYENDHLVEQLRGLLKNSDNKSASAYNDGKNINQITFDHAMAFPQHHIQTLIKTAEDGVKFYQSNLFDGSFGDQYYRVNAVIGKRTIRNDQPSWATSLAFFNEGHMEPSYEMHFQLYKDGIIRNLKIVYPNFSIIQTLTDLKLLEIQACD